MRRRLRSPALSFGRRLRALPEKPQALNSIAGTPGQRRATFYALPAVSRYVSAVSFRSRELIKSSPSVQASTWTAPSATATHLTEVSDASSEALTAPACTPPCHPQKRALHLASRVAHRLGRSLAIGRSRSLAELCVSLCVRCAKRWRSLAARAV